MVYIVIGIIVLIGLCVWWLDRRGASGMSTNGSTDTVEGAMGQMSHNYGANREGGGF